MMGTQRVRFEKMGVSYDPLMTYRAAVDLLPVAATTHFNKLRQSFEAQTMDDLLGIPVNKKAGARKEVVKLDVEASDVQNEREYGYPEAAESGGEDDEEDYDSSFDEPESTDVDVAATARIGSQRKKYGSDVVRTGKRQRRKDASLEDLGELKFMKKRKLAYDLGAARHGSLDGQNGGRGGGRGDCRGRAGRGGRRGRGRGHAESDRQRRVTGGERARRGSSRGKGAGFLV